MLTDILINNLRQETPVTRDRLKTSNMQLLDGPSVRDGSKTDRYNIMCAYILTRHQLLHGERIDYQRKHGLKRIAIFHAQEDMVNGRVSYKDGQYLRAPKVYKRTESKPRQLFKSLLATIINEADSSGNISVRTIQRLLYAKSKYPDLDDDQVYTESILMGRDRTKPWKSFVSLDTVRKLIKEFGLKDSPLEHTKAPPKSESTEAVFQFQREVLRLLASEGSFRLINCAQTSVNQSQGLRRSCYNPKKQNKAQVTVDPRLSVTVILSVCDDGTMLTPFIIDKGPPQSTTVYNTEQVLEILSNVSEEVLRSPTPMKRIMKFDQAEGKAEDVELPRLSERSRRTRRWATQDSDSHDESSDYDPHDDATPEDDDALEDETKSAVLNDEEIIDIVSRHLRRKVAENKYLSRSMLKIPCIYNAAKEVFEIMKTHDRSQSDPKHVAKRVQYDRLVRKHEQDIVDISSELNIRSSLESSASTQHRSAYKKKSDSELSEMLLGSKRKRARVAKILANTQAILSGRYTTCDQVKKVLETEPFSTLITTTAQRLISQLSLENMDEEEIKSNVASYLKRNKGFCPEDPEEMKDFIECPEILYTTQPKGGTNLNVFIEYLRRVVIPSKEPDVKTILLLDQFRAHYAREALDYMKANEIYPLYVPRSCTGDCLPLDVAVMKHFKALLQDKSDYVNSTVSRASAKKGYNIVFSSSARAIAVCAGALAKIEKLCILNGFSVGFPQHPIETLRNDQEDNAPSV